MGFLSRLWNDPGPDSGWSWVIAVSTCWITFCTYGVSRAAGVLFVALVETYGIGRQDAAWPFTLASAVACFFAVVAGVMFRYMSTRLTVFIGGALSAIGIGLCFFASDLNWFIICWGVIYGLGLSLSVPLLVSILNEYFSKQRATANGIYLSGSTLGCFFIPPLLGYLVEEYGLRGTMLIQSGFSLHIFIGAILLRPRNSSQFPTLLNKDNGKFRKPSIGTLAKEDASQTNHFISEDDDDPEYKLNDVTGSYEVMFPENGKSVLTSIENENYESLQRKDNVVNVLKSQQSARSRKASIISESVTNFKSIGGSITMLDSVASLAKTELQPTKGYIRLLLEIFSDPFFYMVLISSASCFIPLFTFMMIIMDFGIDRGMSKDKAVLLMSAISVPELIGRLCFGWISDKGYVKYKTLFMIAKLLSCVLLFALPQVTNDAGLFAVAGIYGAVESCSLILLNVLFVEYLGLEKLPIAFSWAIFLSGFIFVVMPQIIGLFRDSLGRYDYLFYLLAIVCLVSSLSWLLEPFLLKRKSKKESK